MGSWIVVIAGHGGHHNERPDDANEILGRAVAEMEEAGHTVVHAQFTLTGQSDDLRELS